MSDDLFYLVGYDEGGSRQTEGAAGVKRLVCNIEGGGKLAIWGREGNTANLDAVLAAGLPCVVRCMCEEPDPWAAEKYGHTHWIPGGARLEVFRHVDIGRRGHSSAKRGFGP